MESPVSDQETLESLGARVRPLLLTSEGVHFQKGMGALGFLLHQAKSGEYLEQARALCKHLTNEWKRLSEQASDPSDPTVRIRTKVGEDVSEHSWRELAWAWVYIDLVHEDSNRVERSGRYGISQRYCGAAILVAKATIVAVASLNLIRNCVQTGLIDVPEYAFSEKVDVDPNDLVHRATALLHV